MAEQKRQLSMLGQVVNVVEVPVVKSNEEGINTYTLEDGSSIKVKNVATSVMRIDGQTLPDGRPVYMIFTTPVITVENWKAK